MTLPSDENRCFGREATDEPSGVPTCYIAVVSHLRRRSILEFGDLYVLASWASYEWYKLIGIVKFHAGSFLGFGRRHLGDVRVIQYPLGEACGDRPAVQFIQLPPGWLGNQSNLGEGRSVSLRCAKPESDIALLEIPESIGEKG